MQDLPAADLASDVPKSLLGVFLKFIRQPFYDKAPIPSKNSRDIVGDILRLYSLELVLLLPLMVVISAVTARLGAQDHPISEVVSNMPLYQLGLMIVILAPLIEESIFRFPLRYSPLTVALLLALLSLFIPVEIFLATPRAVGLRFALAAVVGLGTRYWLHHHVKAPRGHAFYAKHIGWIFYVSVISFGALHIFNFDAKTFIIAPLVVMPQLTLGALFGFIRLRYGFWWSVFIHGFHNFCALFPYALMRLGSAQLQEQGFSTAKDISLPPSDYILATVLLIFVGGGLFLCLRSVIQTVREWRLERRMLKASLG